MHNEVIWPCIFGCTDARDELNHYLRCPILWCIARDSLGVREDSIQVGHRLGLSEPSAVKFNLLAFCHSLYHSIKNDCACIDTQGMIRDGMIVQRRAGEIARHVRHMILQMH